MATVTDDGAGTAPPSTRTCRGSCCATWPRIPTASCWTAEGSVVFVDISGLHEAVGEAREDRQGGRRAGHRRDRGVLHRPARRRLRERRQPDQVRRRRAAAVVRGGRPRRERVPARRSGCDARSATSAGSKCPAATRAAPDVGRRAHRAPTTSSTSAARIGSCVVTGPGWTGTVAMEHVADAGEILVSPQVAGALPPRCIGEPKGPGFLLKREPPGPSRAGARSRPTRSIRTRSRTACRRRSASTCSPAAARPSTGRSRSRSSTSTGPTTRSRSAVPRRSPTISRAARRHPGGLRRVRRLLPRHRRRRRRRAS